MAALDPIPPCCRSATDRDTARTNARAVRLLYARLNATPLGSLPMKVLVVDDHVLIREALRGVLKELKEDATVLDASDSGQAMRQITQHPELALILLDLNLPDRNGFEVLTDLRHRYPAISIVVLSGFNDRANVVRALDLAAMGFIPKTSQREVMMNALRLVLSGGIYIPPEILVRE